MELLLANEGLVLTIGVYAAIVLVIFWETFLPRRRLTRTTWIRWLNNAGLWLLDSVLSKWLYVGITLSITIYAQQHEIGLFPMLSLSGPAAIVFGFLLLDFTNTVKHRLFHTVPWLWRIHVVHHSDPDFDMSTSLRSHPLDSLVDSIMFIFIVIALGVSPLTVLIYTLITSTLNPLRHGNIHIPEHIDRFLRLFIVTPDYHRIHHSSIKLETNSNYSVLFPWWDWLMWTYCADPVQGQKGMRIGLEYFRNDRELWLPNILAQPFRKQISDDSAVDEKKDLATVATH